MVVHYGTLGITHNNRLNMDEKKWFKITNHQNNQTRYFSSLSQAQKAYNKLPNKGTDYTMYEWVGAWVNCTVI